MSASFDTYRWHSINLVPTLAVYLVADTHDLPCTSTAVELTVLGRVFRAVVPRPIVSRAILTGARGPAWSRRRRLWYSLS